MTPATITLCPVCEGPLPCELDGDPPNPPIRLRCPACDGPASEHVIEGTDDGSVMYHDSMVPRFDGVCFDPQRASLRVCEQFQPFVEMVQSYGDAEL